VTAVGTDRGDTRGGGLRQRLKLAVAEDWYGYPRGPHALARPIVRLARRAATYPLRGLLRQVPAYRPAGRALDIGCGSGGYLAFLARLGWSCSGVEPGARSRTYAREVLGLDVEAGPLAACRYPSRHFDVVTMWHVLEHLSDPLGTLREIRRILKPDGRLLLRTPNVESLEARVFRGDWYGLDPPRHLFLYSPRTLRPLLERHGFHVATWRYQYHPTDLSRSLLYALEGARMPGMHAVARRWIAPLEFLLTLGLPLRRLLGRGGAIHVEATLAGPQGDRADIRSTGHGTAI
jgi:2-polyprenyl-3-methyl-5-hydroxy-6-metoxy-1,4-benzoquinol methylase